MALDKFHSVAVPVWGEISVTVDLLRQQLQGERPSMTEEVADRWRIWRHEKESREKDDRGQGLNSASIFAALNRHIPENAVIAVNVGNNTYSFGRYFECTAQSVLMSGYLGSIGFGYPAAMGAWAAAPDQPIVAITGDGGFAQYMGELTTAVTYKMPIKHFLLNNSVLGKISKEQQADHFPVWQTALKNPDFSKYAQNCGAFDIRVTKKEEMDAAIEKAPTHDARPWWSLSRMRS